MRIGSAWVKAHEDTGKIFISISLDYAALPLTIREDKFLTLWEIPESEQRAENAPNYSVNISKSRPKEGKK